MKRKSNSRGWFWDYFNCISVGLLLALAINLVIIFFLGISNDGVVTISVNQFGEQWLEMVLFPICIIIGLVTWVRMLRNGG